LLDGCGLPWDRGFVLNAPTPITLLARQPLLDRRRTLVAYELLYRHEGVDAGTDSAAATSRVLLEALSQIGLDVLAGDLPVLINFSEDVLPIANGDLLPPERVIVEVLESVVATPGVLADLARLKAAGVRIALDDFRWSPSMEPLLALADFVKLDVLACGEGLPDEVQLLRARGLPWIAEKVETHAQERLCLELGCMWLQGYFLFEPQSVRGRRLESGQLTLLQLISALQEPDVGATDLAAIIERDVALTYRVLRLASGAAHGGRAPPRSVAQAIVVLGLDVLRQWATVLALARLSPDKPPEILRTALTRGRCCERLGSRMSTQPAGRLFMLGLLSVLDSLLDQPMEQVVSGLALPEELRDALCGREIAGLSDVLRAVLAYERGDWAGAAAALERHTLAAVRDDYLDALRFAAQASDSAD
jgi:EAL and modified HD-GYP domain-containing signal transduction protein